MLADNETLSDDGSIVLWVTRVTIFVRCPGSFEYLKRLLR